MDDSEFFKIIPMELQEKALGRANLVEGLSRRSSIFPGQSLLPVELTLAGSMGTTEETHEDTESEADSERIIPFPHKQVTNANLKNIRNRLGIIQLSFTAIDPKGFVNNYPTQYFTWTEKEKLLLVFAENFRRKFSELYPWRQPIILAPKNECGIQVGDHWKKIGSEINKCFLQKFVSTTIRPSSFTFADLIGSWEKISSFVADFIEYVPLEVPTELVSHIKTHFSKHKSPLVSILVVFIEISMTFR